jgi:hypothetical protein
MTTTTMKSISLKGRFTLKELTHIVVSINEKIGAFHLFKYRWKENNVVK